MHHRVVLVALALVIATGCQGGDALPLSQTGQDTTILSGVTAFGTVTVGQTSGALAFVVKPAAGAQNDTIDAITWSCPDFTVTADNLPASVIREIECGCTFCKQNTCTTTTYQTYPFSATFHPSVGGAQSCVVTLHIDSDTANQTMTLSGTGMVPPVDIDVQPTSIAFGDVRVGSPSSVATVNVRNLGGSTMTVSAAGVSPADFTMTGATSFDVPAGGSYPLGVQCTPPAAGGLGGSLSIDSNDANQPNVSIPLSCNGVMSSLDLLPSPATLPLTRVGSPSTMSITIQNAGTASTNLASVSIDGPGLTISSDPGAQAIGAGGSVAVGITFDGATHGDVSGTLTVVTDEGARTAQVTARAVEPTISLAPDGAVDFGPVCIGQMATQMFTILDLGDGDFAVTDVSTPDAPFTSQFDGPGTVQASGANMAKFEVTAKPTDAAVATSAVTVTTDIAGDPGHVIAVSVTGLPSGASATPATLDLGSNPLDTTTVGQTITLTNCDVTAVDFTNARIEGLDADAFTIVQSPTSATIAASGAANWLVVFAAHAAGAKTATFSVDYTGGTATVALLGEGLDPSIGAGGGSEHSYYTCSAGGASAAWPVGLALLAFGRRRRRA